MQVQRPPTHPHLRPLLIPPDPWYKQGFEVPSTLLPSVQWASYKLKSPVNEVDKVPEPSTKASPSLRGSRVPGLALLHTWHEALRVTVLATPFESSLASATRQLSSKTL